MAGKQVKKNKNTMKQDMLNFMYVPLEQQAEYLLFHCYVEVL